MLPLSQNPHHLLLLIGLLFLASSFFLFKQYTTVDIHVNDTYFIVGQRQVFWLLSVMAFLIWIIYLMTKTLLYSKSLIWAHMIVTMLAQIVIGLMIFLEWRLSNATSRHYFDFNNWNSADVNSTFTKIISVSIVAFILAQTVFILNVTAGLLMHKP